MRALVGRFPSASLSATLAEPVKGCARQRTALPIPWMGPGLTAELGGPSSTAKAAVRVQVSPCTRMPMPVSLRPIRDTHNPDDVRFAVFRAGLASGDDADTAAATADPSKIVIAGNAV